MGVVQRSIKMSLSIIPYKSPVRFAPLSANPKIEEIKPKYPNKMTIFFASVNFTHDPEKNLWICVYLEKIICLEAEL